MADIQAMVQRSAHRGPDGQGWKTGSVHHTVQEGSPAIWALGHTRLAILDPSPAGRQPMSSDDDRYWLTFNGEIYNYIELRQVLGQLGYQFATRTDTEVLLAAYRHWGDACVEQFRGMFAFVLVDLRQQRVLFGRDPLGIKPLYLWQHGDRLAIASEPKQLIGLPGFTPRADKQQLVDYLTEGLLGHESWRSMFDQIQSFPAGHRLSFPLGDLPAQSMARSYWRPSRTVVPCRWDDAVARTGDVFRRSVQLRLRSDVPVGACLSGGIDSSSIVGVAAKDFGVRMKTFSVCNDDPRINEQRYIDAVNDHCGTQPVKWTLREEDILNDFDQFIYHQDEPVFSLSQYAEFRLMKLARDQGVPVLLNGQGGDEAMCGYRKYAFFYLRQLLSEGRHFAAIGHLMSSLLYGDRQLFQFWQAGRYLPRWMRNKYDAVGPLLRPSWQPLRRSAWRQAMRTTIDVHEHQWADLTRFSLPVLLRYQDRNSMAHGVEGRVPFVDHEFVEFMLTMPIEHFFRRGRTKRLLVDALAERLPRVVRRRRTKLGFDTPQQRWMRGRLGEQLQQRVANCQRLDPLVDRQGAADAFARYRATGDQQIPHFVLFRLACLASWLDRFEVHVD